MTNPTINLEPHAGADHVAVTRYAASSMVELLELCDRFLRTASPATRAELLTFLAAEPIRLDAGWLIDMLGFNALYLQGKLALAETPEHTHVKEVTR